MNVLYRKKKSPTAECFGSSAVRGGGDAGAGSGRVPGGSGAGSGRVPEAPEGSGWVPEGSGGGSGGIRKVPVKRSGRVPERSAGGSGDCEVPGRFWKVVVGAPSRFWEVPESSGGGSGRVPEGSGWVRVLGRFWVGSGPGRFGRFRRVPEGGVGGVIVGFERFWKVLKDLGSGRIPEYFP